MINDWSYLMRGQERTLDHLIDNYLYLAYPTQFFLQNEIPSTGILVARIDQPQLNFHIQNEPIQPAGKAVLNVVFSIEEQFTGQRDIPPANWTLDDIDTSAFSSRLANSIRQGTPNWNPGGSGIMMVNGIPGILISTINGKEWFMTPEFPIQHGKVLTLNVSPLYNRIRFIPADQQGNLQWFLSQPPSLAPYTMQGNHPINPRHELHLYDRRKQEYVPLSQISTLGEVADPERYVEPSSGRIRLKLFPLEEGWLFVPRDALLTQMILDYSQPGSSSIFLGRPLLTVQENAYQIPEGGKDDTN
jgi:hypothetical protein